MNEVGPVDEESAQSSVRTGSTVGVKTSGYVFSLFIYDMIILC